MTSTALVPNASVAIARDTIATHSKSFALASKLLDARTRDQTAVVYTYCRRADDAIDNAVDSPDAALASLRTELDQIYSDAPPADPVLASFARIARERAIPRLYPEELLEGFAMDVEGVRYESIEQLRLYCHRVAGVVGLMMCHVFGLRDDAALVPAAQLGVAMQLTNICRDVAEDWQRGRLYIPDEILADHGASGLADDLAHRWERAHGVPLGAGPTTAGLRRDAIPGLASRDSQLAIGSRDSQLAIGGAPSSVTVDIAPKFVFGDDSQLIPVTREELTIPRSAIRPLAGAVEELLAIADRHYRAADRGIPALPWRAALAVRAARRIYSAIGARIADAGYDVTAGRAVVGKPAKVGMALAATGRTLLALPGRAFAKRPRIPTTTLEARDVPLA